MIQLCIAMQAKSAANLQGSLALQLRQPQDMGELFAGIASDLCPLPCAHGAAVLGVWGASHVGGVPEGVPQAVGAAAKVPGCRGPGSVGVCGDRGQPTQEYPTRSVHACDKQLGVLPWMLLMLQRQGSVWAWGNC